MPQDSIDEELQSSIDRASDLSKEGKNRSAFQMAREVSNRAKEHGRLIPFLDAQFQLMVSGHHVHEPGAVKDAAIAAIALMENEAAAAEFEPGFDERGYRRNIRWMLTCSYDNLAKATGTTAGYNSAGLHRLIGEGIEVTKRVGKSSCLTCFREYATDVFRAGDDIDMAMFHARKNLSSHPGDGSDRRAIGGRELAELQLLMGRPRAAARTLLAADKHAEAFHDAELIHRTFGRVAAEIAIVDPTLQTADGMAMAPLIARDASPHVPGEDLDRDMDRATMRALEEVVEGELDAAESRLASEDSALLRRGILSSWFEVRLRRLGVLHLARSRGLSMTGSDTFERLSDELEQRANEADDYLTIRRLRTLPSLEGVPAALALLAMPSKGDAESNPEAADSQEAAYQLPSAELNSPGSSEEAPHVNAEDTTANNEGQGDQAAAAEEPAAWHARMKKLIARCEAAEQDDTAEDVDPLQLCIHERELGDEGVTAHACLWLLDRFCHQLDDPQAAWDWARSQAAEAPDSGQRLAVLASLGSHFVEMESKPLADRLSLEAVDRMFERAGRLAQDDEDVYTRIGNHHLRQSRKDEAERAFSRSHRLDRENGYVATRLAELYSERGSDEDALEVLDLCLRAGNRNFQVAWDASIRAFNLGRWQRALSYLDVCEATDEPGAWLQYYRAASLMELKRWEECLEACSLERARSDAAELGVVSLEALAHARMGSQSAADERLEALLARPLSQAGDMSQLGLCNAFDRALQASQGGRHTRAIRQRAFGAGLVLDDFLRTERHERPLIQNLGFFELTLHQPLPRTWGEFPACLEGSEDWTAVTVRFGVLASSEDEAKERVLTEWPEDYGLPPSFTSIQRDDDRYRDHPGITWQSYIQEASSSIESEGSDT